MKTKFLIGFLLSAFCFVFAGCKPAATVRWEYKSVEIYDPKHVAALLGSGEKSGQLVNGYYEAAAGTTNPADRFEIGDTVKRLGDDGWEMVSAQIEHDDWHMLLVFKRPASY